MKKNIPGAVYLKDYRPPAYRADKVDLDFQLRDDRTIVKSKVAYFRASDEADILVLDGRDLELASISLNGRTLQENEYALDESGLKIKGINENSFSLEIETIIYPANNTALEGLYVSNDTYCTQCEAEGFRKITYFPDRPDIMSTFTVRIEADALRYPVLLSNGNLEQSGTLENGRHFALWHDPFPKPCYLFALVAGKLEHIHDTFTTCSGREVDLYIYCRKGDENQCWHSMESLKKAMKWDEDTFGREYDLDIFNIVAISDFNMGAMENKSLNIFNTSAVLAHPETATDTDFLRVEAIVAHEYFHNWTGNRITCRDWFQLSLKEGLTVFRDQEFSSDMNSRAVQRIEDVIHLRRFQFPEDSGPLAHPVRPDNYIEINNFYTVTVYEKGAEVIRMIARILGNDGFRRGMDLYFDRHDGQAVTCMDFIKCMEDANDTDLNLFSLWYEQAGTPELEASGQYDTTNHTYRLSLSQHIPATPGQPVKKPMHIPVDIGLVGPDGRDMAAETVNLVKKSDEFIFNDIPDPPVLSILRGYSAPVRLKTDQSDDELRFLMIRDSDGFNRWESGQKLALRQIGRMIDAFEQGGGMNVSPKYVKAYSALLDQAFNKSDKLLLSKALVLPEIAIIAQERKVVDPAAIYKARQCLIGAIVRDCRSSLEKVYEENNKTGKYSISPEAIASRTLKNTALGYLAFDPASPPVSLLERQLRSADNMTDRIAALSLMIQTDAPDWEQAFGEFRERYIDYPLVIDKWFSLQASAVRDDTVNRITELKNHKNFTLKNPNRVRSLYSAFAMNNPVNFHTPDGSGYRLLAEAVKQLNGINPGIAARLLTPLRDWRRYTPDRQDQMKAVLEDIASMSDLSKDVYEVVSKSLG